MLSVSRTPEELQPVREYVLIRCKEEAVEVRDLMETMRVRIVGYALEDFEENESDPEASYRPQRFTDPDRVRDVDVLRYFGSRTWGSVVHYPHDVDEVDVQLEDLLRSKPSTARFDWLVEHHLSALLAPHDVSLREFLQIYVARTNEIRSSQMGLEPIDEGWCRLRLSVALVHQLPGYVKSLLGEPAQP